MKQDFIAMQLLPDEMQLLMKNIKDEIKIYHQKLLINPQLEKSEVYQEKLTNLELSFVDARDLITKNILYIFETLGLTSVLEQKFSHLTPLEKRIVLIIKKIIVVTKVVLMENPFELLEKEQQKQLAL